MSADALRLLAARSEHGYTDRLDRALPDEPEAVSADWQRDLTRRAARAHANRVRAEWEERRSRIAAELEGVRSFARELDEDVRLMQRQLDKLDRRARAVLTPCT